MLAFDWKFNDKKNQYESLHSTTLLMCSRYFKWKDESVATAEVFKMIAAVSYGNL